MLLKFLARITTTATSEDLVGCRHVCSFHNLVGTPVYVGQNMPPLVGIGLRWLSKRGGDQSPCPHAHGHAWADLEGCHTVPQLARWATVTAAGYRWYGSGGGAAHSSWRRRSKAAKIMQASFIVLITHICPSCLASDCLILCNFYGHGQEISPMQSPFIDVPR